VFISDNVAFTGSEDGHLQDLALYSD